MDEFGPFNGNISFKIKVIVNNDFINSKSQFVDKRDNQTYNWIRIGSQVWMAENLNYKSTGGSWCYKDKSSNCDKYGRLYTWETAKKVCPAGWHLPSDDEWKELEMYLGMSQADADDTGWHGIDEGDKLKATSGWNNNGNGTNSSGFTALPGGLRYTNGTFYDLGYYARFWSATELNSSLAWNRNLYHGNSRMYRNYSDKNNWFSVRCLKD